jgi:signal transduction histidine kinase
MKQGEVRLAYLKREASLIIRVVWLAFALLVLCLTLPSLGRYTELLETPCDGANCFETQLTTRAAQEWTASGEILANYALLQTAALLITGGLAFSLAVLLIWLKANELVSVLAAFAATALAAGNLSGVIIFYNPQLWLPVQLIRYGQVAGLLPLLGLFPNSQFQPRLMRWVALAYVIVGLIYFMPGNGNEWGSALRRYGLVFALISLAGGLVTLIHRYQYAVMEERKEQLLWAMAGIGLAACVVLLYTPLRLVNLSIFSAEESWPDIYKPILVVAMFLAVGSFTCLLVAFFNYDSPQASIPINRTLVYGALTAFIISAYAISVAGVGALLHIRGNIALSFVATGLAAIAFNPFRERLQQAANRLMFGERDEPYRVLARLGQLLEVALQPAAALPVTVETVARSLKLPYVAVTLQSESDSDSRIVATYGAPQAAVAIYPLVYGGESIGELIAGLRAPNEPFVEADQQLLNDLAKQIGAAAYSAQLTADLERARLRIVTAREETRQRLGSDLHDGVGHQLTGLARQLELASHSVEHNPVAAREFLKEISQQLNAAIAQVRGLAHQLHPPELELLGLAGSLRERAQMQNSFAIRMDAPDSLPPLPTAIETTAYYIALEALTNVEKHAGAKSCQIRLALVDSDPPVLEMDIADDGRGLSPQKVSGLGSLSMQARAAEVGGWCWIESTSQGGVRVSLRLPCPTQLE